MSNRTRRLTHTCTITRRPNVGQSGVTTVAQGLACSQPYPASSDTRRDPQLASITNLFEMVTANAAIDDEDILTLDGETERVFHIRRAQEWQSARRDRRTFFFLVVEEFDQ